MKKIIKEISVKTLVVSGMLFASIFIFAFLAHESVHENEDMFDTKVFNLLNIYTSPSMLRLMQVFSFFGSLYFLIPAYIILIFVLLKRRQNADAINILVISIASTALMFFLKAYFHRPRPDLTFLRTTYNYSFPSGHALSSFIFCSVLIHLLWQSKISNTWKYVSIVLLLSFSISIGISRIVLRYHFASDVLAGFCFGFVWVILSFWIQRRIASLKTGDSSGEPCNG